CILFRHRRLYLRDRRLLFLYFFVLFQKFIEQHRVHLVVAHSVNFAVCIANHEIGIHLGHVLSNETELPFPFGIDFFLVAEADRFKPEDGFTGFIHRSNLFFKSARGWWRDRAELASVGVNIYRQSRLALVDRFNAYDRSSAWTNMGKASDERVA